MIIKDELLSKIDELYYYKGKPFEGAALTVVDGVITKKTRYQLGQPVGRYVSPYFPFNKDELQIETKHFTPAIEEPYIYNGRRFCGVTYYFWDGQCKLEQQFEEGGWLVGEVSYDNLGKLRLLSLAEDDLYQEYKVFDDGTIEKFKVADRKDCSIALAFVQGGAVRYLNVGEHYFSRIKSLHDRVKFCLFDDINCIAELIGAETLCVSGDGMTEEVFDLLMDNDCLKNTISLFFFRTPLGMNSLKKLISLNNIGQLKVKSKVLMLEDLKHFKSERPDCTVIFNEGVVT